jgi:hypothetical protein
VNKDEAALNDIRNALFRRAMSGELTRDEADAESVARGAGRIFNHSLALQKADLATLVWKETFGDNKSLSPEDARSLGCSLASLPDMISGYRQHTKKGSEKAALAKLVQVRDDAGRLLASLKSKDCPSGDLAVRFLQRRVDVRETRWTLMKLRRASNRLIATYDASQDDVPKVSPADRLVIVLASLFQRYAGQKATVPLSERKNPSWAFVVFVYSVVELLKIDFAVRGGRKTRRKPSDIVPLANQPEEMRGLSLNTIHSALKKREGETGVMRREIVRFVRQVPGIKK